MDWIQIGSGLHMQCVRSVSEGPFYGPLIAPLIRYAQRRLPQCMLIAPLIRYAPELSFRRPIDSITVSGHKMLGCPMPCGIALTRRSHVRKIERRIDYLNSVDTTIMGSRNGHAALHMWHSLRTKGLEGIKAEVASCLKTAVYLRDSLSAEGITCQLNDLSSTVILERPADERFVKRWQLACEEDIAHVVVMPNVTTKKVRDARDDAQR